MRLLGDVGGTNVRLALQASSGAPIEGARTFPTSQFESLEATIRAYLDDTGQVAHDAAIGIACPITGDWVQMTNLDWAFSIKGMRESLGLERLLVINDFTAQALAVPGLKPQDMRLIGGGAAVPAAPVAVIGPGTGLGVSGLLPSREGHWVPIRGEGGHVTLSPCDDWEAAVIAQLRHRFDGHASAEQAISGQGLENLYLAVGKTLGQDLAPLDAADIAKQALAGTNEHAHKALSLMCSLLGTVAGNLVLTLGALGGVYLVGGILPRLGPWLDASPFRERFEAKGRYKELMRSIPTWLVTTPKSPALAGAARALDEM